MKTLREYIDQLDEISRRVFLKGAGVAALGAVGGVAADRFLKNQQNKKIVLPDDPTAYYLLGYQWGFSYVFPYNETIKAWLKETGPYIGEVTLRLQASGPDRLTDTYKKGFEQARSDIKQLNMSDQEVADYYAKYWAQDYNKLISKLNQTNEESLEETSEDPIAKIDALFRNK